MAPHTSVSRRPQLPAFCRTRRQATTVTISSLRQLRGLVYVLLTIQLSSLFLLCSERIAPPALRSSELSSAGLPSASRP